MTLTATRAGESHTVKFQDHFCAGHADLGQMADDLEKVAARAVKKNKVISVP